MARGRITSDKKLELFLEGLRQTGQVKLAAKHAGSQRNYFYQRRKRDPEFAAAWAEAIDIGLDLLEDAAVQRALDGAEMPVFYQGQQVGSFHKPSDKMLIFLLKAHRPERYGDKVDVGVSEELKRLLEAAGLASPVTLDGDATVVVDDED